MLKILIFLFLDVLAFSGKVAATRKFGSSALDLAYLASGRCDGVWERNLNYWDIAAGIIIVKEAGGTVTDFKGGYENDDKETSKTE